VELPAEKPMGAIQVRIFVVSLSPILQWLRKWKQAFFSVLYPEALT
jgi:hypothetical protein